MNMVDPEGRKIIGVTKSDAANVVEDLREIFKDDVFAAFRELIVQSGKNHNGRSLAIIDQSQLEEALEGVTLTEDQQALVEIVVNTINSKDKHIVEYSSNEGNLSPTAYGAFLPGIKNGRYRPFLDTILEKNGGYPAKCLISEVGDGGTTKTNQSTYSVIFDGDHPFVRAVTTGHELFGHGRSLALGRGDENQHEDAVRLENLILRVMGIHYVNDGRNHMTGEVIQNPSLLPNYR